MEEWNRKGIVANKERNHLSAYCAVAILMGDSPIIIIRNRLRRNGDDGCGKARTITAELGDFVEVLVESREKWLKRSDVLTPWSLLTTAPWDLYPPFFAAVTPLENLRSNFGQNKSTGRDPKFILDSLNYYTKLNTKSVLNIRLEKEARNSRDFLESQNAPLRLRTASPEILHQTFHSPRRNIIFLGAESALSFTWGKNPELDISR
ncbi:hypothetical protein AVEN_242215-1 [Araneus ventricosus]|uniref:Uncharacterized protein n=1 Tax=Araneus ventricosus TaxID=182803 RepID=A0A4Y2FUI1_ARAVE|nr:hypothetical protein AVEN_242215-1 [Araneus ventricosus]